MTTSRGGQYNNKQSSKSGSGSNGGSGGDRSSRKGNRIKNSKPVVSSESHINGASSVLEEFRANKNRSWTAFDVKGMLVVFSCVFSLFFAFLILFLSIL